MIIEYNNFCHYRRPVRRDCRVLNVGASILAWRSPDGFTGSGTVAVHRKPFSWLARRYIVLGIVVRGNGFDRLIVLWFMYWMAVLIVVIP